MVDYNPRVPSNSKDGLGYSTVDEAVRRHTAEIEKLQVQLEDLKVEIDEKSRAIAEMSRAEHIRHDGLNNDYGRLSANVSKLEGRVTDERTHVDSEIYHAGRRFQAIEDALHNYGISISQVELRVAGDYTITEPGSDKAKPTPGPMDRSAQKRRDRRKCDVYACPEAGMIGRCEHSRIEIEIEGKPHVWSTTRKAWVPKHGPEGKRVMAGLLRRAEHEKADRDALKKKPSWIPTVADGETLEDVPLDRWIGEALGAASMCWVGGTGSLEFDGGLMAEIYKSLNAHVQSVISGVIDGTTKATRGVEPLKAPFREHYFGRKPVENQELPEPGGIESVQEQWMERGYALGYDAAIDEATSATPPKWMRERNLIMVDARKDSSYSLGQLLDALTDLNDKARSDIRRAETRAASFFKDKSGKEDRINLIGKELLFQLFEHLCEDEPGDTPNRDAMKDQSGLPKPAKRRGGVRHISYPDGTPVVRDAQGRIKFDGDPSAKDSEMGQRFNPNR